MTTVLDAPGAGSTAGLEPAVEDIETADGDLIGIGFQREAIDRNYWALRQRRIDESRHFVLSDISEQVYGDRSHWKGGEAPASGPYANPMTASGQQQAGAVPVGTDARIAQMFEDLEALRAVEPGVFANLPTNFAELDANATEKTRAEMREESDELDARAANRSSPNATGAVAEFVGAAGSAVSDIEGLATLPLAGGSGNLARTVVVEAVIGAGSELATLPAYNAQAEFIGREKPNPLQLLAFGAAFGGALPLAGRAIGESGKFAARKARVTNKALLAAVKKRSGSSVERGAATQLAREEAIIDVTPKGVDVGEHVARIDDVEVKLDSGEPVVVSPDGVYPSVSGSGDHTEQLLQFVRSLEAPEGYDQVYSGSRVNPPKPITQMTISEVRAWQDASVRAGAKSSAAGGFQIIRKTLDGLIRGMGLTGNELFDEAMQKRMAIELMKEQGLDQFLSGQMSATQFGNRLSGVWAALPKLTGPRAGRSQYEGIAGNKALTSTGDFLRILSEPGSFVGRNSGGKVTYNFEGTSYKGDTNGFEVSVGEVSFRHEWRDTQAEKAAARSQPPTLSNAPADAPRTGSEALTAHQPPTASVTQASVVDALREYQAAIRDKGNLEFGDVVGARKADQRQTEAFAHLREIEGQIDQSKIPQLQPDQKVQLASYTNAVGELTSEIERGRSVDDLVDGDHVRALVAGPPKGLPIQRTSRAGDTSVGSSSDNLDASYSEPLTDQPASGYADREPELFGDPVDSNGITAQIDQLERDFRAELAANPAADIEFNLGAAEGDGGARLSDILTNHEEEADFLEQLNICMPKGVSNG